jgi:arsenite oxidase small subunit
MGGDLSAGLREKNQMLVCAEHLTSYDLTRHGIVVAGHATESLPQIVLEVRRGDIYAVAIAGLLYGYHRNPV